MSELTECPEHSLKWENQRKTRGLPTLASNHLCAEGGRDTQIEPATNQPEENPIQRKGQKICLLKKDLKMNHREILNKQSLLARQLTISKILLEGNQNIDIALILLSFS